MQPDIQRLGIPDVVVIRPKRFVDTRGYFTETFRASWLDEIGPMRDFVQDNQAGSAQAGTIRGLHYQVAPHAQAKLVRVLTGAIFDVAVDLRGGSATYGSWVGATLTAAGEQILVPAGFAHGYCTLEPETVVAYKCDAYYAADAEAGVTHDDPDIGIDWPAVADRSLVSDKDAKLPRLADIAPPFLYEDAS